MAKPMNRSRTVTITFSKGAGVDVTRIIELLFTHSAKPSEHVDTVEVEVPSTARGNTTITASIGLDAMLNLAATRSSDEAPPPIRVARVGGTYLVNGDSMTDREFENWRQTLPKNQLVLVAVS